MSIYVPISALDIDLVLGCALSCPHNIAEKVVHSIAPTVSCRMRRATHKKYMKDVSRIAFVVFTPKTVRFLHPYLHLPRGHRLTLP